MLQIKNVFLPALVAALSFVSEANTQAERPAGNPDIASTSSLAPSELTAADGVAGNALGTAVAMSGNTVVVGENCGQIGGNTNCDPQHQGVVYVYQMPTTGWRNMTQTAELTPSDGFVGDGFGTSVAISGSTIVVGEPGKVYVFARPNSGWKNMTETAQLTDGRSGDFFGNSVAINNNTIVVGAPTATIGGNQSQGAAYVFLKPQTGWVTTSTFNAELSASDGSFLDIFGISWQ